ncbi:MAG: HNH endonuclease [Promethearchaeota archaeon]|nr:MAG: HNH endonuclease [Candidatus Lokiarchaeota archaeon]
MLARVTLRLIRHALKNRREYDMLITTKGWYLHNQAFPSYLAVLGINRNPKPGESTIFREFLTGDKMWRTPSHTKVYRQIFLFPAFPGIVLEGRLNARFPSHKVYYLVVPHRCSHVVKISSVSAMWWVRKMASVWGILWGEFRAIPASYRGVVYERDQGRCVNCHRSTALEYDHIIPFSKGGATSIENLQLLCQRCNRRKYNHIREPIPEPLSLPYQKSTRKPQNTTISFSILKKIAHKLHRNTSVT